MFFMGFLNKSFNPVIFFFLFSVFFLNKNSENESADTLKKLKNWILFYFYFLFIFKCGNFIFYFYFLCFPHDFYNYSFTIKYNKINIIKCSWATILLGCYVRHHQRQWWHQREVCSTLRCCGQRAEDVSVRFLPSGSVTNQLQDFGRQVFQDRN